MGVPVLIRHDPGCRYARESDGGHSDAARRLSDTYNLHRAAGTTRGWIAVRLADGRSDRTVYETRAAAIVHQHHDENWRAYISLAAPVMTICEAASVLRWHRQQAGLRLADRDDRRGGPVVIPRLTQEDRDRQLAALAGRIRLPIALGYVKEQ